MSQRLGGEYQSWLVIGKLAGGKEEEEVWGETMLAHSRSILVFPFDQIIREYVGNFTSRPPGLVGQLLDVLNELGLLRIDKAATASPSTNI